MKNRIKGVGVALVTPFNREGGIDFEALGRVVEHVVAGGVDYMLALGTTAETPTLTQDEKRSVIAFVRERNAGRLPLIVGVGGNDTAKVVRRIKETDLSGVDALLSVTPYYNKPSQEGLFRHYETVAGESPVPVILYNVPARTGVNMTAETTLRIAHDVDNVLGIKEACGVVGQMAQLLRGRPEGFRVISGDDVMALPLASIGGDGVISVAANAFPRLMTEMIAAAGRGDTQTASGIFLRLYGAVEALFAEGNPTGVKTALSLLGITGNQTRLPLTPGSAELTETLKRLIERDKLS